MEFLSSQANRALLERLRSAGLTMEADLSASPPDGPLSGRTVVITGGLGAFSRDDARRAVVEAGGKVTSSVSRTTSFVVAGADPGSKLQKATALNVPVVDEDAFGEILAGRVPSPTGAPAI